METTVDNVKKGEEFYSSLPLSSRLNPSVQLDHKQQMKVYESLEKNGRQLYDVYVKESSGKYKDFFVSKNMGVILLYIGGSIAFYGIPGIFQAIKGAISPLQIIKASFIGWKTLLMKLGLSSGIATFAVSTTGIILFKKLIADTACEQFWIWQNDHRRDFLENQLIPEEYWQYKEDDTPHLRKLKEKIQNIYCPITQYPVRHPVRASDGQIYESCAISSWLHNPLHTTSPITRQPMTIDELASDNKLAAEIEKTLAEIKAILDNRSTTEDKKSV